MLKLKLEYFGHLMRKTDSSEKTLMLGKIEGGRRRGRQRMTWFMESPTQWTWVWVNSGSCDRQGGLVCCSPWGHKDLDMTEWLNWTTEKSLLLVANCSANPTPVPWCHSPALCDVTVWCHTTCAKCPLSLLRQYLNFLSFRCSLWNTSMLPCFPFTL